MRLFQHNSHYMTSNKRIICEWWVGMDVEGSGGDQSQGTIPVFGWKYWGKLRTRTMSVTFSLQLNVVVEWLTSAWPIWEHTLINFVIILFSYCSNTQRTAYLSACFPNRAFSVCYNFRSKQPYQLQGLSNYMRCSGSVDAEINIRLNARQIRCASM
jgi:hypothetical protein